MDNLIYQLQQILCPMNLPPQLFAPKVQELLNDFPLNAPQQKEITPDNMKKEDGDESPEDQTVQLNSSEDNVSTQLRLRLTLNDNRPLKTKKTRKTHLRLSRLSVRAAPGPLVPYPTSDNICKSMRTR